jgi:nicotinamidase-related amidase
MLLEAASCQLVLVDFQEKLMPAIAQGEAVMGRARLLAQAAKALNVPITGTEQNPAKLGAMPADLRALCGKVMPKLSFSACRDGLVDLLDDAGAPKASASARSIPKHLQRATQVPQQNQRSHIILAGCEAHVCLLQTALDLLDTEEFEVSIVTDACGSRRDVDRDAAFDRLAGAGAQLITAEMAAFEWLGSAEHAQFQAVHALIK